MPAVNRRTVSDEIRDRLLDQLPVPVEVGERTVEPPCIVVHPITGGTVSRFLDPRQSVNQGSLPYQLTCVGVSGSSGRDQCEQLAADAIDALTDYRSEQVQLVAVDSWGEARPDRDEQPEVWVSAPMVRVTVDTA